MTPVQLQIRRPLVLLRVDGEMAEDYMRRLVSFRYHDRMRKRDTCTMTFSNRDGKLRLNPGAVWEVRWGRWGRLGPVRALTLKSIRDNFDAEAPEVVAEFQASRGRTSLGGVTLPPASEMHRHRIARNWGKIPSSKIASAIAKRHRLKAVVEDSDDVEDTPFIQSANVSDYEYLNQLALDIDFEFFIEGKTLYYRARPIAENPYRTIYHSPIAEDTFLLSFLPEAKIAKISVKANAASDKDALAKFAELEEKEKLTPEEIERLAFVANSIQEDVTIAQESFAEDTENFRRVAQAVETAKSAPQPDAVAIVASIREADRLRNILNQTIAGHDRVMADASEAIKDVQEAIVRARSEVLNGDKCADPPKEKTKGSTPVGEHAGQIREIGVGDVRYSKTVTIGQPLGPTATPEGTTAQAAAVETTINTPETGKTKRKKITCAALARYSDRAVEAKAVLVGDRQWRAKVNYRILHVRNHSGDWYSTEAVTDIGQSYTVSLTLKRGTLNKLDKKKAADPTKDKATPAQPETVTTTVREIGVGDNRYSRTVTRTTVKQ